MYFNYIYHITILKVEKLFIPFLVSCVTGGKIVLISKVNFVLLRLKQKKQDMITSVKLMLNKSRILNNGSYPLVFQVIHNRRKKLLYTGYRMKEEVFDESEGKIMNGVSSTFTATEVVKMNRELRKMRNRIDTRIRQLERTREEFTVEDILGKGRTKNIKTARNVSMYVISKVLGLSLNDIGKMLDRDHSTVHSNIKAVENEIRINDKLNNDIIEIVTEVKS